MIRSKPTFPNALLATLALLALPPLLHAADYHVTPSGSGTEDGSSWANALPQEQIAPMVDSIAAGDRLLLGSGSYTIPSITINSSGVDGSPKGLVGVDTGGGLPLFQGDFDVNDNASSHFISFPGAAHYWEIKNLRFKDQPFVITLNRSGTTDTLRTNLLFENLHFDTIEDAIRLYNASDVLVKDCTVVRHTKKAFRIGDYTSFITFDTCFTDCNEGDPNFPSRSIPNGFALDSTDGEPIIHDITFKDCIANNNGYSQGGSAYWNGDGFSSERGAYNIFYIRCKAFGNNDAGFDNKASYVTYQDCVSAGNSRGFRHWADNGQMFNCVAAYNLKKGGSGSSYGIWISGSSGVLNVDFSTVHGDGNGISVENGGVITVSDSILSSTSSGAVLASAAAVLIDTATYRPGEGTDPNYVAPDPDWQGSPSNAMDSQTYGLNKGYNSGRVDETPNAAPTLSITSSNSGGIAPVTVDFTSTAMDSDGSIISYLWDFGDGAYSNEPNPSHTYNVPGDYDATCTVTDNRGSKASDSLAILVSVPTTPVAIRIESGNTQSFTDTSGNEWSADHSSDNDGGIADRGAIAIAGTADDRIYQTERWGVSSYSVLLANGLYEVKLHFAETYSGITAPGQRVFSVSAEDTVPASWADIDVFAESGGSNTALVKPGFVEVEDNLLDIVFTASADNPMISGIEILPAASGDLPPVSPSNFSVSDVQTDAFTVSWDPATDETGVDSYDVYLDGSYLGTTANTSYAVSGLSPYTPYVVTLRVRDTVGNLSAPSAGYEVKTLDDGTTGNDVIIDNDSARGVTIVGDWTTGSSTAGYYGANYQHNGNIDQGSKSVTYTPDLPAGGVFEILLRWTEHANRASNLPVDIAHADGSTTVSVNQRNNGGTWYSLGNYNLASGTANSVTLRTDDTDGYVIADSVRFLASSGPGPDTEAPSVPANLQSSGLSSSGFSVTWDAATDNVGIAGYEIYLDGTLHSNVTDTTATFSGLAPETAYSVSVKAYDAANNVSAASAALAVTTPAESGGGNGGGSDGVVSVNLTDAANALSSADVVGAVAASNWNNSTVNNEQLTDTLDSEGNSTTVDIKFSNTAYEYVNATPALATPLDDDAKMMRSQRALSNSNKMAVTADEIDYDNYDVYLYWGGLKAGETAPTTMALEYQLWDGSAWVTQETKYIRDDDHVWDGTYNESTATLSQDAVDGNEYVVFRNRSDAGFKVLVTAGRRVSISGLQIVSRDATPPSTPANLLASDVAEHSFTLTWDPSTDNVGVTGYEVFLDGVFYGDVATESIQVTGLAADTTYLATVLAYDEAGNRSAESSGLAVTTQNSGGSGGTPVAGTVSVNLTGPGNELAPADVAGAVPAANWSNSTVNNEILTDVLDSDGDATTVDIAFVNTPFAYDNDTPDLGGDLTDDAKMMRSQRARSNVSKMALVASELPYSSYDVYVYWGGRKAGEIVPLAMEVNLQLLDGSEWVIQETKYLRDDDHVWDGSYDESTASTAAAAADGAEYVVFRGLSENSFRILTDSGNRTSLSGIQIVPQGSGRNSDPNGNGDTIDPPTISSQSSASGTLGTPFVYQIEATEAPSVYSASGLPAGLVLDPATGAISGTPNSAGSYSVELAATNAGGTSSLTLSLVIDPSSQAIAFPNPGAQTFGDGPLPLEATASSGLPVSYQVLSGPAEIDGTSATLNGAGIVEIRATQAGNSDYLPAAPQTVSFDVAKATAGLVFDGLWQLYDGQPKSVSVVTDPADLEVTLTYDGRPEAPTYPGYYDIVATIDDPDYEANAAEALTITTTVVTRQAPTLNGAVDGSVHVLEGQSFNLNGSAAVSGDILLPGSPKIRLNGQPIIAGLIEGLGAVTPDHYRVTVNGNATARFLVSRVDPVEIPEVAAPPALPGTTDVSLNNADDSITDFASLRHLTLNSGAGLRFIEPGSYGRFTANGGSGFAIGIPGAVEPAVYNLQELTLNGPDTSIEVLGPVILTVANDVRINSAHVGDSAAPENLTLRVADGDLTLNGDSEFNGFVEAPEGRITVNGGSTLRGCVQTDRLVINGHALITW